MKPWHFYIFKSFQGNGYGGNLMMGRNYMSHEFPSAKDTETYCREDKSYRKVDLEDVMF